MESEDIKQIAATTVHKPLDLSDVWFKAGHVFTQSLYCRYCGMSYISFTMNEMFTVICPDNFKRQIEAAIERDEKSHNVRT